MLTEGTRTRRREQEGGRPAARQPSSLQRPPCVCVCVCMCLELVCTHTCAHTSAHGEADEFKWATSLTLGDLELVTLWGEGLLFPRPGSLTPVAPPARGPQKNSVSLIPRWKAASKASGRVSPWTRAQRRRCTGPSRDAAAQSPCTTSSTRKVRPPRPPVHGHGQQRNPCG